MARIDDLIDRLGKAKYITTLDLAKGNWQVPVTKEAHPKPAFLTPFGLNLTFCHLAYEEHQRRSRGAPATFQRSTCDIPETNGSSHSRN